jgi:hypothetical protein
VRVADIAGIGRSRPLYEVLPAPADFIANAVAISKILSLLQPSTASDIN